MVTEAQQKLEVAQLERLRIRQCVDLALQLRLELHPRQQVQVRAVVLEIHGQAPKYIDAKWQEGRRAGHVFLVAAERRRFDLPGPERGGAVASWRRCAKPSLRTYAD